MKIVNEEFKLCFSCMENHIVRTVEIDDEVTFKGQEIPFKAQVEYCSNTDTYSENDEQMSQNNLALKDAYRIHNGLLSSQEIKSIREKYGISQKEFSEVLGWGAATIIRYENHQVQDRAHDDILRKINADPKWFLEMLTRAEPNISPKLFKQYSQRATEELLRKSNPYTYHFENSIFSIKTFNPLEYSFSFSSTSLKNPNRLIQSGLMVPIHYEISTTVNDGSIVNAA